MLRISADCGDLFLFRSFETSVHKLSGHNRTPFLYPIVEYGMSGPIVDAEGHVVAVSSGEYYQPRLPHCLPRWFEPLIGDSADHKVSEALDILKALDEEQSRR